MYYQQTINKEVEVRGLGLHSGQQVKMKLRSAPPHTGIVFIRCDLPQPVQVPAKAHLVQETALCTGLMNESGVAVYTIEHLMSAIAGLHIDNMFIELGAAEVPILDGSASPFVYLIQQAGIKKQSALKQFIHICQKIRVESDDKWLEVSPFLGTSFDCTIDFKHPSIQQTSQRVHYDLRNGDYLDELGRARTFGFFEDVQHLRAQGLILGAGLNNAIVLDADTIMNTSGLRYPDEFVRHKMLDLIGDLSLLGNPLLGQIVAYKPGHRLNNLLARKILEESASWYLDSLEHPHTQAEPEAVLGLG
jgi:UDP-3-O-[3-hydroxymyristoyl] N-acetylglucosamine deacetylase